MRLCLTLCQCWVELHYEMFCLELERVEWYRSYQYIRSTPYKKIEDHPGFWVAHRGFPIPGTGFRISLPVDLGFKILIVRGIPDYLELHSGFQRPGLQIPQAKTAWIRDSTGKNYLDSGFHKQKLSGCGIPPAKISCIPESGFPYMRRIRSVSVSITVSHITIQHATDPAVLCATSQWPILIIFILLRFLLVKTDLPGSRGPPRLTGDWYSLNSQINLKALFLILISMCSFSSKNVQQLYFISCFRWVLLASTYILLKRFGIKKSL